MMHSDSRHQFLVPMPKAKVSWLLCIGRLVSKTDNVMHFARLVEQASVTRFCDLYVYYRLGCDLFVYGAYMVHRSMRVGTVSIWGNSLEPFDLLGASDTAMLIKFEFPGWDSYAWWQHAYVSRDLNTLNWGCVTTEVSSLTQLTNDAFRFKTPVFGSNAES